MPGVNTPRNKQPMGRPGQSKTSRLFAQELPSRVSLLTSTTSIIIWLCSWLILSGSLMRVVRIQPRAAKSTQRRTKRCMQHPTKLAERKHLSSPRQPPRLPTAPARPTPARTTPGAKQPQRAPEATSISKGITGQSRRVDRIPTILSS